jgi:hypothetical protein
VDQRSEELAELRPLPVRREFTAVKLNPLADQSKGPARERPMEHLGGGDSNLRLELAEAGVEVGRRMIVEVHDDHDPTEG